MKPIVLPNEFGKLEGIFEFLKTPEKYEKLYKDLKKRVGDVNKAVAEYNLASDASALMSEARAEKAKVKTAAEKLRERTQETSRKEDEAQKKIEEMRKNVVSRERELTAKTAAFVKRQKETDESALVHFQDVCEREQNAQRKMERAEEIQKEYLAKLAALKGAAAELVE